MRAMRVLWVMLTVALFGSLGLLPPEGSAEPETLQAISLAYPLRQRYKITSLHDHTGPGQPDDNQIQIYTGALVRNDPGAGDECSDGLVWSYTDGDTHLWDLRWDQDTPCAGGGPGWLWYDHHGGYDLACPNNTPVNAAHQGTAHLIGNDTIRLESGSYQTRYLHLGAQQVREGEYVQMGKQIGLSGVGGTGAHLHFEVRYLSGGTWTYVDPSGWEQGNLWAGGEPFPLGYVDQNNNSHGPFLLDNTKIRDKWLSMARRLGSPIEDDFSYPCTVEGIQATGYLQSFERGYISYCGSGAAQATYYQTTFLPRVIASENASAWNSTVSIRNLGASAVSITFFTPDGRVLDSRVYQGFPANATWEVGVRGILYDQFLSRADSNPVFQGSAIVASDGDVAVVVRTEKSDRVTAYTGLSSLDTTSGWGRPATAFYAPTVMWYPWEKTTWKSYLYLQNTTPDQASLTITYCYQDSPTTCRTESSLGSLPPFGSTRVDPASEMGNFFWGFARVVSTNDKELAVVVTQEEDAAGASDYNAFSAGAATLYLPSLMHAWYRWSSAFVVQNLGSQTTYVNVWYFDENGQQNYGCRLNNLRPGASCLVNQDGYVSGCTVGDLPPHTPTAQGEFLASCAVPGGWHGTAILTGAGPLAAVVNQQRTDVLTHQSYSGFIAGGSTLYGPLAASHPSYDSCSDVQNVGGSTTAITSRYFDRQGGMVPESGSTRSAEAGCVATFYVPAEGVGTDFLGSVRLTRSNGVPIAGIHNLARKPAQDDYGASYNLVQR